MLPHVAVRSRTVVSIACRELAAALRARIAGVWVGLGHGRGEGVCGLTGAAEEKEPRSKISPHLKTLRSEPLSQPMLPMALRARKAGSTYLDGPSRSRNAQ